MNAQVDLTGVILHTKRLTIRTFKQEDLKDFNEYASVPGVGEMAGWSHHESIEESQAILNMFISGKSTFAIVYNGKVIGSIGFEHVKDCPEFETKIGREIGFVLSKAYWGQGIMPEAVKEVINYAFNVLDFDFLTCGHFIKNTQSKRVQEKCGFKPLKVVDYKTHMNTIEKTQITVIFKV